MHEMILTRIADDLSTVCYALGRPSAIHRPTVEPDAFVSNMWVAKLGEIVGKGSSPEAACVAFDAAWICPTGRAGA